MKLAVIPARGGSKRIPRKNIREFCGKPIIAYSIETALQCGCFDKVVVSTEDDEIAEVAKAWGADVPFRRPVELADDITATTPVIKHATEQITTSDFKPELVCCIYPTAPFVRSSDLLTGLEKLESSDADFALSVTTYAFPIQRAIRITEDGRITMFNPEHFNTRSQDLEEAYHDAGQFYWGTAQAWREEAILFGSGSLPVFVPRYRVQDIDTQEDWAMAESLYRVMELDQGKG